MAEAMELDRAGPEPGLKLLESIIVRARVVPGSQGNPECRCWLKGG